MKWLHRFFENEIRMVDAANYRPYWYWWGTVAWIVFFVLPIVPGWMMGKIFDSVEQLGDPGTNVMPIVWWGAAFVVAQLFTAVFILFGHRLYMQALEATWGMMRANVLANQLASRRRRNERYAVGDMVARLREDPIDAMMLLDNWVDLLGSTLLTIGAFVLLAQIDVWAALAGTVPLLVIGFGNFGIATVARKFRERARERESHVGDFLNAAFEGALSIKVGGATRGVLGEIGRRNHARSQAKVLDEVWHDAQYGINGALVDVAIGLALLVAVQRPLSAGDIALFATLLFNVQWLPTRIGGVMAGRKRAAVSIGRLDAIATPAEPEAGIDYLTKHRQLPVLGGEAVPAPVAAERVRLESLTVESVSMVERNLTDVSFVVAPRTLTVITGPVGAGKTSLLQGLIGYLNFDSGHVKWNGEAIDDAAAFFVPPQCAYIPQVPRLFAESLADNLRLGYAISDDELDEAIRLAVFEDDVADFSDGMATMLGTRGVRLSGGQVQRAATARALAHQPELLVFDDVSSALDVETELRLWNRLTTAGYTVIAASNRPVAIERADQVISLGEV